MANETVKAAVFRPDVADAESSYRRALGHAAEFLPALENLAALLNAAGREVEGAEYWCRGYVLPPHAGKPPRLLATAFYLLGRYADAAECYRAWLEQEPDNPVARHHLAACSGVVLMFVGVVWIVIRVISDQTADESRQRYKDVQR